MSELSSQPVAWQAFIDGKWHAVEDPVWCVQKGYKVRPLYAAPPAAVPEGWVMVPRKLTPGMIHKAQTSVVLGETEDGSPAYLEPAEIEKVFQALLAAAPPPPSSDKEEAENA